MVAASSRLIVRYLVPTKTMRRSWRFLTEKLIIKDYPQEDLCIIQSTRGVVRNVMHQMTFGWTAVRSHEAAGGL
jgi:hypothetical protein